MGKLPRMLALLLASCFVPHDPIADPDPPIGMHLRCTIIQVFPGEDAQEDDGPPAAPPTAAEMMSQQPKQAEKPVAGACPPPPPPFFSSTHSSAFYSHYVSCMPGLVFLRMFCSSQMIRLLL